MRLTAIVTLVFAVAAFILSMLVLFAGSSTSFLQGADLLTVRTQHQGLELSRRLIHQ